MIPEKYGGPIDIGMKNVRWLHIWFSIGLVEISETLVSRHHLMPKFKYIVFFFFPFLLLKYIDLILVPLCILILKFLLNNKNLKFFIYYMGPKMEGPTDIGLNNAGWIDIWFLIEFVEVLDTLVSKYHLMPKV